MLSTCYQELSKVVSVHKESLAAAQCVEQHRFDWRPEVVHTLLLAESHVLTPDCELRTMRGSSYAVTRRPLNQTFARFVYCLGYGESDFAGPALPSTGGTWQFWQLFASCVRSPGPGTFAPLQKGSNPSFASRIRAKLSVLEEMLALGVWLVDASPVALYSPGGARLHQPDYPQILKCSWHNYVGELVRDAKPHSIIVIGKGVAQVLHGELSRLQNVEVHTVRQPQGCREPGAIDDVHATLHRVCYAAAQPRRATTDAHLHRPSMQ
jgi:hypothetical protein